MRGVEIEARDRRPGCRDGRRPSRARTAPPLGLPAVAHVRRRIRHQHVARLAEEAIAGVDDVAAVHRPPRDRSPRRPRGSRVQSGSDLAHHPQPRDAAVGKDVEAQVGDPALAVGRERQRNVFFVSPASSLRSSTGCQIDVGRRSDPRRRQAAAVDPAMRRIVAAEERGVDDDRVDDARQAELDDAPVVAGRAAAARFPAVHPLAAIGVLVRE